MCIKVLCLHFCFDRVTMSNLILFEAEDTSSEKSYEDSSVDGSYESSFIDDGNNQSGDSCHSTGKIENEKAVSICIRSIIHFLMPKNKITFVLEILGYVWCF